jgi:hypothetical protein
METPTIDRPIQNRHLVLVALVLLSTFLMYLGLMSGPVPGASAGNFCTEVNLTPYGHYGDRCYAWEWEAELGLAIVGVQTFERAGCVTYAAPNSYDLQDSWYCIAKNTAGWRGVRDDNQSHRGVIRNNNLTYSARFSGFQQCCY